MFSYRHTLSLHAALPISTYAGSCLNTEDSDEFSSILVPGAVAPDGPITVAGQRDWWLGQLAGRFVAALFRSEEHTSELQSLMRTSSAVFGLKKTTNTITDT